MQGLSTSCIQQRFPLIRCSDSNDKKSQRRRKTREERRTMVESFIDKYRLSNQGKFPSLNMTHKEVGGSFYIVREIVRDLIQENRVLGPGSPSMKLLTLEDCLEEHETELYTMDSKDELSELSIELPIDAKQKETFSHPCGAKVTDEFIALENNDLFVHEQDSQMVFSHVIDHGFNHLQQNTYGAKEHDNLVAYEFDEVNKRELPIQTEVRQEISAEVQGDIERFNIQKVEQPKPLCGALSPAAEDQLALPEDVMEDCNRLPESAEKFTKINESHMAARLPEVELSLSSLNSDPFFYDVGVASFSSSAINGDLESVCLGKDDIVKSKESLSKEQKLSHVQIDTFSNANGRELIKDDSYGLDGEANLTSVSQSLLVPSSATSVTEEPSMPQIHVMDSTKHEAKCALVEPLSPRMEEEATMISTAEDESDSSSSKDMGTSSSSKNANGSEEMQLEKNPVWGAIKAFVSAFFKFWMA
ncbi:uncharacterized protein LOC122055722 [Zingiber officinale]|uniref:uncharacterized protein LOC122055722 n=1 Tax=Zingiber officinale TaxID=94328 RepID=UPI001C4AF13D|nr:uncharacterized protein LOC122055722 [Zingiber officinale]